MRSPHEGHAPQSETQLEHVSPGSQTPLLHVEHMPQSTGQELQSSPVPQVPSPHRGQAPQSVAQLVHVSPASQAPLPQVTQMPQSIGQFVQVSPIAASHDPLPHVTQTPQSPGQVEQVSPSAASQFESPQTWHMPQSMPHVLQSSVPLQMLSPQKGAPASLPVSGCTKASTPVSMNVSGIGPVSSMGPASMPSLGTSRSAERPQPSASRLIATEAKTTQEVRDMGGSGERKTQDDVERALQGGTIEKNRAKGHSTGTESSRFR